MKIITAISYSNFFFFFKKDEGPSYDGAYISSFLLRASCGIFASRGSKTAL